MFVFRGRVPELLLLLLFSAAANSQSLTLAEAERLAIAAEPGQAVLLERASALREQAVAAGQLPDPKLRVALANFPLESGGFSTEGMTQAQVGLRQAFPPGNSRAVSSRHYESMALEFDASAAARLRDVRAAVRTSWLDAWYWNAARDIVTAMRPLFGDMLKVTESLYSVGRRNQQDVLRAQLELSRLEDRLIDIDQGAAQAQARLSEWIGDEARRQIDNELPAWQPLPPRAQLQQQLRGHPAVQSADARITAASDAVELAQQQYKPGWALDVGYAYRDGRLPNGASRSDFATVGVTLDLPYFRGKRQDRQVAAARGQRRAAAAGREQLLRQLASRLDAGYARCEQLTRRISLYQQQVLPQAHEHSTAALNAYQSDAADFADVMRAAVAELNAQLEAVQLQVDRARSYAVVANLGGIWQ
ncbi:MAG: TolC family protein [Gammaproteobacteria bacterium]|nr:TolC family protein [Gammaproteobacteria bacterium]